MDEFTVNDKVIIVGKNLIGTIAFIGKPSFSKDLWFWVMLDEPVATDNEIYEGIWYFKCGKDHLIFAHPSQVKKVSFLSLESEVQSTSSRQHFLSYLRYDSLMKLKEKQDSCENKRILLEKDITLKSALIPSCSSNGNVILNDIFEVKPKSITHSENHLTDKQLSHQEKTAKNSSANKETKMLACELRGMALKTRKELKQESLPEAEVRKVSSLKQHANFLTGNSSSKPNAKHDRYTKKSTILKDVREGITLKSTSIPFFAPGGDVILLDDYKFEVKPKSIPHSEKYSTEEQSSQKEKDSSLNKETEMQACELGDMNLKTSNELNEVVNDITSLGGKTNKPEHFPERQFSQDEKEPKDSSSDEGKAYEIRDMISMASNQLNKAQEDAVDLDSKTESLEHIPEKQFSHLESKDSSDKAATAETRKPMVSKESQKSFYFSPSICLTILGLSIALFFLHTYLKY